ncbi:putative transcription factor AP2-EREBP family [Helianthus annuus]|uniref:Putative related to AP2 10 n=1 Tax=Helianthus annuus TaxID=4232 RepID=A0A251UXI0_HELAN|nr:ethylene-responsive transcription factor RAP2-10 [Helianthus annuus]KAF5808983.1 putative transcription factor AP2-EREBP family [Helianthus annuus]KAJ0756619.1 putative transcription factor AP2-EREBP family [Helianthus annuus]KAJ0760366.1 putative transcription factor AP2-EREBP family [Helianthus annuus]KAJ0930161.1 putative transcription factor AP2-EREBP family [Helianthus annuus]
MEPAATTAATSSNSKPYRGIRMRKWGKWVAEIREPNKRSRIWLGSYSSPIAAARAYDTAVFYLRGPSARLNFPDSIGEYGGCSAGGLHDLSAAAIRKKATEVGAKVDALENQNGASRQREPVGVQRCSGRVCLNTDLNEYPTPETSDEN